MITILDAIAPTAFEAFDALLAMMTAEGGDWAVGATVALPLGGFQISATRNAPADSAPVSDDELAALKAAAVGTPHNSPARLAVEMAIDRRRMAAARKAQAETEARIKARNNARNVNVNA